MANTTPIIHKRTSVSGRLPSTDPANTRYVRPGELSINLTDKKAITSNGSVLFEIGSNLSSASITTLVANGSTGAPGQSLSTNGSIIYWADNAGFTGSQGIQGSVGWTGSKGEIGVIGFVGSQGAAGFTGSGGAIGYSGSVGFAGSAGSSGFSGSVGFTGSAGAIGYSGSIGTLGYAGSIGSLGYAGSKGFTGSIGITGFTGSGGAIGYSGSVGVSGYDGSKGFTGSIGITGFTGSGGAIGYSGSVGFSGSVGTTGFTGSIGITGYSGSIGGLGYSGSVGFTGSGGTTGFTGSIGGLGYSGSIGGLGYSGSVGFTGSKGDAGFVGSAGATGYTGSVGSLGFSGSVGFTGSFGVTGFTGSKGDIGFTGSAGFAGSVGSLGFSGSIGAIGFAGSTGFSGSVGFAGSAGYAGSKGDKGDFGGASYEYLFSNNTVNPTTIGTGKLALSNLNLSQANTLYIAYLDQNSANNYNFLQTIDDSTSAIKGTIKVYEQANILNFADFSITGTHTEHTDHFDVPVAWLTGATAFANNLDIIATFIRTGDRGDIGYSGSVGALGFTGSVGLTGFAGSSGFTGSAGYTGSKGTTTVANTAPVSPVNGDTWWNSANGIRYVYYADGTSNQWVQESANGPTGYTGSSGTGFSGSVGFTGSVGSTGFTGSIGTTGFAGSRGFAGSVGFSGSVGITGFTGSGGTGFTGSIGAIGFTGSSGGGGGGSGMVLISNGEIFSLSGYPKYIDFGATLYGKYILFLDSFITTGMGSEYFQANTASGAVTYSWRGTATTTIAEDNSSNVSTYATSITNYGGSPPLPSLPQGVPVMGTPWNTNVTQPIGYGGYFNASGYIVFQGMNTNVGFYGTNVPAATARFVYTAQYTTPYSANCMVDDHIAVQLNNPLSSNVTGLILQNINQGRYALYGVPE